MITCDKCRKIIDDCQKMEFNSNILCEDCYIDDILPKVRKVYYEDSPAEFMQRLQNSFSVIPQQHH